MSAQTCNPAKSTESNAEKCTADKFNADDFINMNQNCDCSNVQHEDKLNKDGRLEDITMDEIGQSYLLVILNNL